MFAVILANLEGANYTNIALWLLALFIFIGIMDVRTTKVVLDADQLEIISNFRWETVPRIELVRVASEKGAPAALEIRGVA